MRKRTRHRDNNPGQRDLVLPDDFLEQGLAEFKTPRRDPGRPKKGLRPPLLEERSRWRRFSRDPHRMAAALAMFMAAKLKAENPGRYKIVSDEGPVKINDKAASWAVDYVNNALDRTAAHHKIKQRASLSMVKSYMHHRRGTPESFIREELEQFGELPKDNSDFFRK